MAILIKRLLFFLLLVVMLAPALQAKFHFFEEKPLGGAYTLAPYPEFTWDELRTNTFQPAMEKYLEEELGFRPFLIRLRNQLAFSLFHVAHSSDVTIGKHGVLFEPQHIYSYAGHDLMEEKEVRFRVRRLRLVQQALSLRGVHLLFVMAPNKARFQPEDLPDAVRPANGTITNYDLYVRALQHDTVALLNMVPLFAEWKRTKPYPLFPRGGTHWSGYGATLAADTLLRRLEQLGNIRFPTVRTAWPPQIVRATDSLRATDNDLVQPLNLMQQVEATPLAYRQLVFDQPQPGQTRPAALFVGDSFTWGLANFSPYLLREFADDTRVWYYGYGIHIPDERFTDTGVICQTLNLQEQIESRKFIVLITTEHNLIKHEFDFTDRVYRLYYPPTAADNAAIDQIATKLMQNANKQNADSAWKELHKDEAGYMRRNRERAEFIYENQRLR